MGFRSTELLEAEQAPCIGAIEPREGIVGPHLGTVAEHSRELALNPVADVHHECRWFGEQSKRVRDDGPETRAGPGPAPGDGRVDDLSHHTLRHRDVIERWCIGAKRPHRVPGPLVDADVIEMPVQTVFVERDHGVCL